ncbi:P-loop containing nucleoside triphosphate hydrolase protein [Mytilinidion resinicola]|uniref:P-loop containing nucleoside triphosphate hydrolase protein n=1 Tax=Mytilinidion resinicola TaxID=574789 RepID=A0A6A6XZJ1_9PEZI|nr:P-loop containing nucleoside triphosphate hydrolase protein [Mytilinidion resinicola]KAF2801708.1 P-loop containing nucleoside triphosphate hydrolase protein [Mytilinidion resinicola]
MDFSKLQRAFKSGENGTQIQTSNLTNLPSNILEAFIPGYSLISKVILDTFGFDVGIVVSVGLIAFALLTSITFLWSKASRLFQKYCMSSVFVDDGDDLFDGIIQWIAEQRMAKVSRSVKAVTRLGTIYGDNKVDESDDEEALDANGIFNFGKWAAKLPPRYEPYFGSHRFWHAGRLYVFDRSKRERQPSIWSSSRGDEELIELKCIGRSTKPIKALLSYIKTWSLEKEKAMTVIRRPAGKDRGRGAGSWDRVSSRPSRPMDTVSLDPDQKRKVVEDINEYLHPSSPRWYATRGIPYRRGYLFHGPPGTGKTSLSFALAGIFGLDIFCISLLEPTLTESDLNRLFNNLPRRCIVLLEDIDTAGLLRDEKSDKKDDAADGDDRKRGGSKTSGQDFNMAELTKAIKTANRKDKGGDDAKQGVSLSGLLNAIDGVATHEGRVLVMTTNRPEKLDNALIRPGRVDMQVEFTLATRDQIRDIFIRMYSNENDKPVKKQSRFGITLAPTSNGTSKPSANGLAKTPNTNGTTTPKLTNGFANGDAKKPLTNGYTPSHSAMDQHLDADLLRRLADDFAREIPEGTFSPAEIQGFLLTRKKEPLRAAEEVQEWRDAVVEAREKKAKVVSVQ